jgi:hypothetical protein
MTTEEQVAFLTAKLNQVVAELAETQAALRMTKEELQTTKEALGVAQARIAELDKLKMPPPTFVKANKKKPKAEEKKPRKKREAPYNRARPRSVPTQIVEHRIVEFPSAICGWAASV